VGNFPEADLSIPNLANFLQARLSVLIRRTNRYLPGLACHPLTSKESCERRVGPEQLATLSEHLTRTPCGVLYGMGDALSGEESATMTVR
jgi:hypothetical protein